MKMVFPLDLVIFDCDGVILESVDVKTQAFGLAVAEHGPEAVDQLLEYHLGNGGVSRMLKFEWFYENVLQEKISDDGLQKLAEKFEQLSIQGVLNAPMVAGAMEAIEALHGRVPLFVASGAPHDELIKIFFRRNLSRYFDAVWGSPPGKAELLERIISNAGAKPQRTLMVGDSSTDIEAAEACGTLFYGRGSQFKNSNRPWGEDLYGLLGYIDSIAL